MTSSHDGDHLTDLIRDLCALPNETEWVEFKTNNCHPDEIGKYVSALSNSAVLADQQFGYLVWGVENVTHEIVGTSFDPRKERIGVEELENWLLHLLTPEVSLRFDERTIGGRRVVLLRVGRAFNQPVRFKGQEFIRVGSYRKKLADHSAKERALWQAFERTPFEDVVAADGIAASDALQLLDYPSYFRLLQRPLPEGRQSILDALAGDHLVRNAGAGRWDITNLGAILFATRLEDFPSVRRKPLRIILYDGTSRVSTIREPHNEPFIVSGYASGFEEVIDYIVGLMPSNEVIQNALRRDVPMYPVLAVRELIANALIHQDLSLTGAGPTVEIFKDRLEVTNPGTPLIETDRFLDKPPRSRNEKLAALMRRIGICEERGSGVDKIVWQTELYQFPAPMFEATGEATRAVLFAHRPLARMEREDRVRACYLHACLRYVNREYMTNTTIRERFGIEPHNSAAASRFIREAVGTGLIKPYDEDAAKKLMKYVPFWA